MTLSQDCRPRVLLVDDHLSVLQALFRLLETDCDVVAKLNNGEEAIEAVRRLKPDVIVVDLMMPGMDGFEVCRCTKNLAPESDVIILTAFEDAHSEKVALEAGASAFISKYAAAAVLVSTIQGLIGQRRSVGDRRSVTLELNE